MTNSQPGIGRTEPLCAMSMIAEPGLPPSEDSPPLDPIRTMLEHLVASVARVEARMDDYDRHPASSRQPHRPDPEPPDSRPAPRSLEANMPYIPPFAAVSVATPPLPSSGAFLGFAEGFRHNPTGLSSSWQSERAQRLALQEQQVAWDMPPRSRTPPFFNLHEGFRPTPNRASTSMRSRDAQRLVQPETHSAWDLQELQSTWDLPPASRLHSAWDNWGNRFSEPHVYSGGSSWDPPGQRQPASMDVNVPHIPPFSEISSATPSYTDPYSQPQYYTDPYTDPPPAMLPADAPPYTVDPYYVNNIGVSPAVAHNVPAWDAWGNRFSEAVDEDVPAPPSEGLRCSSLAFVLAEEIGPVHIEKYSQLASPIVPPPPPQRSPSCWSSTGPTSHCCSAAPLPAAAAAPSLTLPPPAPPCSPDIIGVEEALLNDEEKVGSFAILGFAQVRGEKCSSRDKVERNELLRAHCFTFGILEELVNHSSPIGGVGFSKEDISFCSTLNLIQSERMVMVPNGAAFIPRRHSCPFDPGGDISHLAYVISDSRHCFVVPTLRTRWFSTVGELIREYLQEYPQISLS